MLSRQRLARALCLIIGAGAVVVMATFSFGGVNRLAAGSRPAHADVAAPPAAFPSPTSPRGFPAPLPPAPFPSPPPPAFFPTPPPFFLPTPPPPARVPTPPPPQFRPTDCDNDPTDPSDAQPGGDPDEAAECAALAAPTPPPTTTSFVDSVSVDRGGGGVYAFGDPITVCFSVNASLIGTANVIVTDSGPTSANQVYAGPLQLNQQLCIAGIVTPPAGTDTVSLTVTSIPGSSIANQTPATTTYTIVAPATQPSPFGPQSSPPPSASIQCNDGTMPLPDGTCPQSAGLVQPLGAGTPANPDCATSDPGADCQAVNPAVARLVILARGIDPGVDGSKDFEPYQEAEAAFGSLLVKLQCQAASERKGPLVTCANGVAWVPYSYRGVTAARTVARFTGADTGESLGSAAKVMDAIYLLGIDRAPNAKVYIVGHSLGGAVAAYWGADHGDVKVYTLDSPVNGIWAPDDTDPQWYDAYCYRSTGLLSFGEELACKNVFDTGANGLKSAAAQGLHDSNAIQRMASANVFSFANPADMAVPSWFALSPNRPGRLLPRDSCALGSEFAFFLSVTHHGCILQNNRVASDVYTAITCDTCEMESDQNQDTNETTITVVDGFGTPLSGVTVTPVWPSSAGFSLATGDAGEVRFTLPWRDVLFQASYCGDASRIPESVALPADGTPLTITMQDTGFFGC